MRLESNLTRVLVHPDPTTTDWALRWQLQRALCRRFHRFRPFRRRLFLLLVLLLRPWPRQLNRSRPLLLLLLLRTAQLLLFPPQTCVCQHPGGDSCGCFCSEYPARRRRRSTGSWTEGSLWGPRSRERCAGRPAGPLERPGLLRCCWCSGSSAVGF